MGVYFKRKRYKVRRDAFERGPARRARFRARGEAWIKGKMGHAVGKTLKRGRRKRLFCLLSTVHSA